MTQGLYDPKGEFVPVVVGFKGKKKTKTVQLDDLQPLIQQAIHLLDDLGHVSTTWRIREKYKELTGRKL